MKILAIVSLLILLDVSAAYENQNLFTNQKSHRQTKYKNKIRDYYKNDDYVYDYDYDTSLANKDSQFSDVDRLSFGLPSLFPIPSLFDILYSIITGGFPGSLIPGYELFTQLLGIAPALENFAPIQAISSIFSAIGVFFILFVGFRVIIFLAAKILIPLFMIFIPVITVLNQDGSLYSHETVLGALNMVGITPWVLALLEYIPTQPDGISVNFDWPSIDPSSWDIFNVEFQTPVMSFRNSMVDGERSLLHNYVDWETCGWRQICSSNNTLIKESLKWAMTGLSDTIPVETMSSLKAVLLDDQASCSQFHCNQTALIQPNAFSL